MRKITTYQSVDGKMFRTEKECLDYEALLQESENIMRVLPPLPKDQTGFNNGGGYIQHDKWVLQSVKVKLLTLIKKHIKHEWVQQSIDDPTIHASYVSRLVDGYSPFAEAWNRFACIDEKGREWGQPYFAANPQSAQNQNCIASYDYFQK